MVKDFLHDGNHGHAKQPAEADNHYAECRVKPNCGKKIVNTMTFNVLNLLYRKLIQLFIKKIFTTMV